MQLALFLSWLVAAAAEPESPPTPEPSPAPESPPEPAAHPVAAALGVELRVPSASLGPLVVGEPFSVVLSFDNPGAQPVEMPIDHQTVRLRLGSEAVRPQWSTGRVALEPGSFSAVFGRVTLMSAGEHTFQLWLAPDGAEPGARAEDASITVTVIGG